MNFKKGDIIKFKDEMHHLLKIHSVDEKYYEFSIIETDSLQHKNDMARISRAVHNDLDVRYNLYKTIKYNQVWNDVVAL